MDNVEIYTDGGCSGNPGPGGWAYVLLYNGKVFSISSGGASNTTNNKMELTAVINALEACTVVGAKHVLINTDSTYVKNGITKWIETWKKNNWITSTKEPVKNKDLWVALDNLTNNISNIDWHWVKGHSGVQYNELCDSLVQENKAKYL